MTKRIIIRWVILIALAAGFILLLDQIPIFKMERPKEIRTLIDSIPLEHGTLYWYREEQSQFHSTPLSYISLSDGLCGLSPKNALVKGDFIHEITDIKEDTVYYFADHDVVQINASIFTFINKKAKIGDFGFKRHMESSPISFTDVCDGEKRVTDSKK